MPPKNQKPKPLTKKEKRELAAKLKLEEEERRKEEERIQREIQEEEERKRKEEEARLAKEEQDRLEEETEKNKDWVLTIEKARANAEQEIKQQQEWIKYKICNEQADPEKEFQLTTFITQYKETPLVSNLQIQEALDQMQNAEEIVTEIMELHMRARSEGRYEDSLKYRNYAKKIRDITVRKLEECTSDLTKNSEKLTDEREEEVKRQQENGVQGKGMKMEQKQQLEVYKIYKNLEDFRYGMWINPNTKSTYRHKPIEFGETLMAMEVPSRLMHIAFLMKACWTSFDYLSNPDVYSKDIVIGGVLDIECIDRPPLQTKGGQWTLKYDFDVNESIKKPTVFQDGQGGQMQLKEVQVHYPLPAYLKIFPKQKHQIALFDEVTQSWVKGNVNIVKYEKEQKLLIFETMKIAPFAYIMDRCTDYPYQKFFMRAVEDNKVNIDIMGMRDTFKFEIGPGYALLKGNPEHPELAHISDRKFAVGSLLHYLLKCGINLMPVEEDAKTATLKNKNNETEDLAIQDICQGIRSFFVRSSDYSFNLDPSKILVRIKENPENDDQTYGEDQEKDWKSICWYPNKCAVIRCGDKGEFCDERFLEGTVAHINMDTALTSHDLAPEWALKRMKNTEYIVMQDTLSQFLKLTHILTFTVFEQEAKPDDEEEEKQNNNTEGENKENGENQEGGEQKEGENKEGTQEQQKEEPGKEEPKKEGGEEEKKQENQEPPKEEKK